MNLKFSSARSVATMGLFAIAFATAIPAYAQSRSIFGGNDLGGHSNPRTPPVEFAKDHFIVVFKPGTSSSIMNSYMQRYGLTVDAKRTSKYFTVLKLSDTALNNGVKADMLVNQFNNNPAVAYAEVDGVVKPDFVPNDPQFGNQFHHNNTGQTGGTVDADIDSVEAWDTLGAAPEVIVAILDDGVDWQHEDIATSIWINAGEIPGNGVDDDGNGFIDDVRGWDFADGDNDPDGDAINSHGTHCAGITGATHNNGIGVSGCGSNIKIMAVRFYPGPSYFSDFANAIDYAWENGAQVISASYNIDGYNQTFLDAVKRAESADVAYVNSAGNNGQQNPPRQQLRTEADNVIFVAANDDNDNLSWFSNYGSLVEVSAPGEDILSLVPEDNYGLNSGTSMSTPLAAGILAQIRATNSGLSARECLDILIESCDSVPALTTFVTGGRRVNFANALTGGGSTAGITNVEVIMGTNTGGNMASLTGSDDNYYKVGSAFYSLRGNYSVVDVTFNTAIDNTDVRRMSMIVESHASTSGISQFVSIYNWNTGNWDNVGNSRLKVGDNEFDAKIASNNWTNYVNGSGDIKLRFNASIAVKKRGAITPNFDYFIDCVELMVGE